MLGFKFDIQFLIVDSGLDEDDTHDIAMDDWERQENRLRG